MFSRIKQYFQKRNEFDPQVGQLYRHNDGQRLHRWITKVNDDNTYQYALISTYGRRRKKLKTGDLSHLDEHYYLAIKNYKPFEYNRNR